MSRALFVFIECNTTGTGRQLIQAVKDDGFEPVVIAADPDRYSFLREDSVSVSVADTTNQAAIYDACKSLKRRGDLAGVVSNSDYFVEVAARVANELGLPCPDPEAIHSCRHKYLQRCRLTKGNVEVPNYRIARSVSDAVEAAKALGLPVVLKPVFGGGSVAVRQCYDIADVESHAEFLVNRRTNDRGLPNPPDLLVEEVAVGPEFSVETFGDRVIGVTTKHLGELPHFVEVGHDVPSGFEEGAVAQMGHTAIAALHALGLGWGPAHVEIRLTRNGPRLIEVNPRLAGDFIPDLYRLALGVDLIRATARAAAGRQTLLQPTHNRAASIRFLMPVHDGVIRDIHGVRAAEQIAGIHAVRNYRHPGDRIVQHGDFRDRLGHAIAVGDTLDEARDAADRACRGIRVTIDRCPVGAEANGG